MYSKEKITLLTEVVYFERSRKSQLSFQEKWYLKGEIEERKKRKKGREREKKLKKKIDKEINWDWFAGLVPKRTSQIQKEPFAAGEWGCW